MDINIEHFRHEQFGKIIALFNCRIGPVTINDMKLISGRNGHFVSTPSRKLNGAWIDVISIERQTLDRIKLLAEAAYSDDNGCPNSGEPSGPAAQTSPPPRQRPVWDPGRTGEDLGDHLTNGEDLGDGLPF